MFRAITASVSDGSTPIAFNKPFTFKGGKLYDGTTEITSALAEGIAHRLKVWSKDEKGERIIRVKPSYY